MLPKRQWMEMTWRDFAQGEPGRWIAVLPVAAVEQHGPHLPLGVDAYIAEAYLARVQALLRPEQPVTFLPEQVIGQSDEHTGFPGTLTLRAETLASVLADVMASVARAGVRKLVFVNSHGGNWQAIERVARAARVDFRMFAVIASWHRLGYPAELFSGEELLHGIHAGEIETSLMRAARPDLVRMEAAEDFPSVARGMEREFEFLRLARPAGFAWMTQDLNPAGAVGSATAATPEKGEAALDFGARAFVRLLEEVERFDLDRLADGLVG